MRESAVLEIELHRRPGWLAKSIRCVSPEIWSRRVPCRLADMDCHVLVAEDMMIHLSLHLAEHHGFVSAMSGLLVLTLVVSGAGDTIRWHPFAERCASLGIAGWVATSLG